MFFLDKPYISEFLKETIENNTIPVVGTTVTKELELYSNTHIMSENDAIETLKKTKNPILYTNSENAIAWIVKHLAFSELPQKIELFKDKVKFRELTKKLYPDFYFKEIHLEDLKDLQINNIPLPFIIKPSVGFFSMGVYKVSSIKEWGNTVESILAEIEQVKGLYPDAVLNTRSFIIEQIINGEEFAIDAYFNASGEAVILGIFKHAFSSDADVSDRVYLSSKDIIETNLEEFTAFLGQIGKLAKVKNFPVHVEVRRDKDGALLPIEVNPMRFGGWCTTADTTYHAYGFNPYLYYYSQKKPNWHEALKGKEGKLFSIIVLDNSTGVDTKNIRLFNYEKLLSQFEKPLELRKIDYKQYPVFGFLFTETREDNYSELKDILDSDLNEFIEISTTSRALN